MAIIMDVLTTVDGAVTALGTGLYGTVATSVMPVAKIAAVLALALAATNMIFQLKPVSPEWFVGFFVKIVLVFLFIGNASEFFAVYDAITQSPARFGAVVLSAASGNDVSNLYDGLDKLYISCLNIGNAISENGGMFAGPLSAIVLFLVAAMMATVSIIVISAAKLLSGILILLAPLAILMTVFRVTAPFFQAWLQVSLAVALVPLLAAAMAGFTIAVGKTVTPDPDSINAISDVVSFIVVTMLGTGLMLSVPVIAQALGQSGYTGLSSVTSSAYSKVSGAARSTAISSGRGIVGAGEGMAGKRFNDGNPVTARGTGEAIGAGARNMAVGAQQRVREQLTRAHTRPRLNPNGEQ